MDDGNILEWTTTVTSKTIKIYTPDMDFGNPGVKKKVYKFYLTYKGNGSNLAITAHKNGDDTIASTFHRISADGSATITTDSTPLLNVGTDDWVCAELKPSASLNNVYSVQLQITGAATDFEINDISVVYRNKRVK